MIHGLDVSRYQGDVNWAKVAATGYAFAFVKATEGLHIVDDLHDHNVSGALAAGLVVGSYHYAHPGQDATAQADHHTRTVGSLGVGRLPCVLDLERTDGLDAAQLRRWAKTWLDDVRAGTGRAPILYTGYLFLHRELGGPRGLVDDNDHLWVADYTTDPKVGSWWQDTSSGHVNGIATSVDLDIFRGTREQLLTLAGHTTPAPPERPTTTRKGDHMEFVTADGHTVYITNGCTETRHVVDMTELADLEHAGLAARPVKRISSGTLSTLLKTAR